MAFSYPASVTIAAPKGAPVLSTLVVTIGAGS